MTWLKLKHTVFGHAWVIAPGDMRGCGAERRCACGAHVPGIVWSRGGEQPNQG